MGVQFSYTAYTRVSPSGKAKDFDSFIPGSNPGTLTKKCIGEIFLNDNVKIIESRKYGKTVVGCIGKDKNIVIPYGVQTISAHAFAEECIQTVKISETVKIIDAYAFSDCKSLISVTLPHDLLFLGEGIFSGCTALSCIELTEKITAIPSFAFRDCKNLNTVKIPDSVVKIDRTAFDGCGKEMKIVCNKGSYADRFACENNITTSFLS